MMGLLIKDFFSLKKNLRSIFFICGFYVVWGLAMDNIFMLPTMMSLLFSMMVITSYYYDDTAKWNVYALTMPLTRRDLVSGKYCLSLVLTIFGSSFSLLCSVILSFIKKTPITKDFYMSIGVIIGVSFLTQSVSIPTIIKLGTEKARIVMFAIFLIPSLLILGISKLNIPKPSAEFLQKLELSLPWICCAFLFILYTFSYYLSIHFMEQKEE